MSYNELIKDINKIRAYIRNFFVFGFYTREEYARMFGLTARSYDNEKRRVESWMGEYLSFHQNADGKKVFLSVSGDEILHNPLYRAFKAKSFTTNDLLLHFYLMDLLSSGESFDQKLIPDLLIDTYPRTFGTDFFPDEKTIRLKLRELEELGLLISKKEKRTVRYQMTASSVDLSHPDIHDLLDFFSEAGPLGVIGSFLSDKCMDGDLPHCFRFRHHYLMSAIDSEILCELLTAIDLQRKITMRVDNAFQGPMQHEAVPLKIFISTRNGREYLLTWNEKTERFFFTRLDRILWVSQMEETADCEMLAARFESLRRHVWGVSFGGLDRVGKSEHLEMEIRAEESEYYIVERLNREQHCTTVTKIGPERYLISADVFDPMEAFPWICSFTGRILRLSCSNEAVTKKYDDYVRQGTEQINGSLPHQDEGLRRPLASSNRESAAQTKLPSRGKGRNDLVFHEVYGAYYNAVARILSLAVRGTLTPQRMMSTIHDKAFSESGIYLADRLLSGEWPLLSHDLKTELRREPVMPLTIIQKRWLKAILKDPKARLFAADEVLTQLDEQLCDVSPLFSDRTVCLYDRFSDGDPFEDPEYIQHFRTVLGAIKNKAALRLEYRNRFGTAYFTSVIPQTLEYSPRDDKFRVYACPAENTGHTEPLRLNMGRILSCEMLPGEAIISQDVFVSRESVVLELEDTEETLERAMFHFSYLEKRTERMGNGRYQITLYYPSADRTEVLIRILSFGQQIRILSEGYIKEETERRMRAQAALK